MIELKAAPNGHESPNYKITSGLEFHYKVVRLAKFFNFSLKLNCLYCIDQNITRTKII